jgi:Mlc titration factor MtfA (ptsG expression regulator)
MTGPIERQGLSTAWERRVRRTAIVLTGFTLIVCVTLAILLGRAGVSTWATVTAALLIGGLVYAALTRKLRRRKRILARPFPAEWEAVLQREVVFFRTLDPEAQRRFRRELQVFLGEKRITGIRQQLDTTTRVLAAASAIIPIFGFPDWEWDQINEVLVYPDRFGRDFALDGRGRQTLGMVGTGALNRLMILSKPDLLAGFRNAGDKRNVGIHEFAHLVDKSDGSIDGLPAVGLDRAAVGPWIELVRRKMEEMRRGDSDIDPYGQTNEAEFFAVASEYFFERPGVMRRKHPDLHAMLERVFNQTLGDRAQTFTREIRRGRPKFGRNSPCPCGSGLKYKKCCLRRS